MRPDLKGWSNSPDYKQKMRNPVIFTLLGDCSAFGLDQVHQHKDKKEKYTDKDKDNDKKET